MNIVNLVGRLTRDIELRYTQSKEPTAVARFTVAIDRVGKEDATDFISCTVWGKQAENCSAYLHKGSMVGVTGRIQTGSYEKDGKRYYTTDIVANRVEFLSSKNDDGAQAKTSNDKPSETKPKEVQQEIKPEQPDSFQAIDEDVPF
jgi:single-strand DNA-binding protein